MVASHTDVIPLLARGMAECQQYMSPLDVKNFLDDMIQARIGIRVIAEHHLALHADNGDPDYSGIIHHSCSPKLIIQQSARLAQDLCEHNYGMYPEFVINGHIDTMFPYIDVHLEYIMLELLKNAFRATVEFHQRTRAHFDVPTIEITIARGKDDVGVRIRDRGGGIELNKEKMVWNYAFTTVEDGGSESESNIFAQASQIAMSNGSGGQIAG